MDNGDEGGAASAERPPLSSRPPPAILAASDSESPRSESERGTSLCSVILGVGITFFAVGGAVSSLTLAEFVPVGPGGCAAFTLAALGYALVIRAVNKLEPRDGPALSKDPPLVSPSGDRDVSRISTTNPSPEIRVRRNSGRVTLEFAGATWFDLLFALGVSIKYSIGILILYIPALALGALNGEVGWGDVGKIAAGLVALPAGLSAVFLVIVCVVVLSHLVHRTTIVVGPEGVTVRSGILFRPVRELTSEVIAGVEWAGGRIVTITAVDRASLVVETPSRSVARSLAWLLREGLPSVGNRAE